MSRTRNPRRLSLAAAAVFALLIGACHPPKQPQQKAPDDFPATAELLRKLQEMEASIAQPTPTPTPPPGMAAQLLADLDAFPARAATLPPEQAAQDWLELLNRYQDIRQQPVRDLSANSRLQSASCVMDVLPGPETWPALQHLVESGTVTPPSDPNRKILLSLFVHTLNHNESAQWTDIQALSPVPEQAILMSGSFRRPVRSSYQGSFANLGQKLSLVAEDKVGLETFWNKILDLDAPSQPATNRNFQRMQLPDFVAVLGRDTATGLLSRLLVSQDITIESIQGRNSQDLARSLALQNIDKIVRPSWSLTYSLDAGDLYDALQKKFGAPTDNPVAAAWHVISLILHNRADEAVASTANVPQYFLERPLNEAMARGAGPQIYDFLHALLAKNPEAGFWDMYIEVAAQTQQAAQALHFVRDTAARPDLAPEARKAVNGVLYKALLANDDIEEGVAGLRRQIQVIRDQAGPVSEMVPLDINLANIGRLVGKKDWESEGVKMALHDLTRPVNSKDEPQVGQTTFAQGMMANYLMTTGDERAAASLQIQSIVDQARVTLTGTRNWVYFDEDDTGQQLNPYSSEICKSLVGLATIYDCAQRFNDILQLLEDVPWWGTKDLLPYADNRVSLYRRSTPTLALMAAESLADAGRLDEARGILDYDLRVDGADDAAYELLLKIGQGDLVARLDELFSQDQFQPRPLIWKAKLLLHQGKVDQAEQTCKQAIAIDPSDGHSGKGDRMRVYSVMADICDAKKDTAQATFFRNVVSAIRLSEDADDYFDAGLLTRAVAMYEKALVSFSDAYCIQSRLARQLATLGRLDEAAIHYRKAFELMPESFGRMESHCFGCERAFQGKTAEQVAGDTFKALLAKEPQKPQVHYLMGYLLKEEGRYEEAVPYFREAVELDPDYINAWNQILDLGRSCHLPDDLHDKATFNLIRLDPAGRHDRPDVAQVTDLAGLWNTAVAAGKLVPPYPKSLFPLTASAKMLEDLKRNQSSAAGSNRSSRIRRVVFGLRLPEKKSPQQILQENTLIQEALSGLR